jgi:enolase-phosphatase E1
VIAGGPEALRAAGIRVVLLDIEGTTTPIAFVHDVLFPYARARIAQYFAGASSNDPAIAQILDGLRDEHARDVARGEHPPPPPTAYALWLMDRDRKSGPLKTLQGKIWQHGYASGELHGDVYPDVPPALAAWTAAGVRVGIFSSGSVLAQKLLFSTTPAGDLTRFLTWHFDTAVGPKQQPDSYRTIARTIGVSPGEILFVSDSEPELDAARCAGMHTQLSVR